MATAKQIKAAQAISENIRSDTPKPTGQILKEVGYSKSISEKPALVTRSQGFIELLEKAGVTDDKLATVINEGLNATKVMVIGKESSESFVDVQPDHPTRHKFLETSLKLKGHITKESNNSNFIQINNTLKSKYDD